MHWGGVVAVVSVATVVVVAAVSDGGGGSGVAMAAVVAEGMMLQGCGLAGYPCTPCLAGGGWLGTAD